MAVFPPHVELDLDGLRRNLLREAPPSRVFHFEHGIAENVKDQIARRSGLPVAAPGGPEGLWQREIDLHRALGFELFRVWLPGGEFAVAGSRGTTWAQEHAGPIQSWADLDRYPWPDPAAIDFGQLEVTDVFPRRVPDLFVGRPILLTGRFQGDARADITVKGKVQGKTKTFTVDVNPQGQASHPGIASVWARKKIEILKNQHNYDRDNDLSQQILKTALTYNLISDFTAFIAVDSSYRTQGDHGVSVAMPVPVPDGVRYDTTVQSR